MNSWPVVPDPSKNSSLELANAPCPAALCPFYDGAETLDLLLGEIGPTETDLLDATLDLRNALIAARDAALCLALLFRMRALLDDRHYLAFYRVRRMIGRLIVVRTRPDRASPWTTRAIPPACARFDELINLCLAPLAADGEIPPTAHIRFAFAAEKHEHGKA